MTGSDSHVACGILANVCCEKCERDSSCSVSSVQCMGGGGCVCCYGWVDTTSVQYKAFVKLCGGVPGDQHPVEASKVDYSTGDL